MYSLLLGFLVNLQDLSYMPLIWVSEFPQWADWFSHPVCFVLSNLLVSMAIAVSHQAIIVSPKVVFPDLRLFLFHEKRLKLLLRIWFSILQNSLSCCKLFLKELSFGDHEHFFYIQMFLCFLILMRECCVCPVLETGRGPVRECSGSCLISSVCKKGSRKNRSFL